MSDYFYCTQCHEIFEKEEAGVIYDDPSPSGVGLPSGHYSYIVCPWCDSDELEDAGECIVCGDPIRPTKCFCGQCREYLEPLKSTTEHFINTYRKNRGVQGESVAYIMGELLDE